MGLSPLQLGTMRKENFRWWKQLFKAIENLFHIYRIDHIVR
jgi:4-alpha-glucanotransferase